MACTTDEPAAPDAGTTTPPTTPAPSHKTLLREDGIGSGPVCPGGGVYVHTGRDTNDDGSLEDSEIEDTVTVCNPDDIFHGDLETSEFATADAQAKLTHVRVVTGNLVIDSDAAMPGLEVIGGELDLKTESSIELPALTKVAGSLVGPPQGVFDGDTSVERAVHLVMPALASVGGRVSMTSWKSDGTFLAPALASVEGEIDLPGDYAALDLHSLQHVGGSLDLATDSSTLALPLLQHAGDVRLSGPFTTLDLGTLESASSIDIYASQAATLALPSLRETARLQVASMPNLTSLQLPALAQVGTLGLFSLPQLTAVDMPQVTALDTLQLNAMAFADLHLFAKLQAVKTVSLRKNAQLAALTGLEQVTSLTSLSIVENGSLATLAGLGSLTHVAGNLTIQKNASLTTLSGLAALTGVSGTIAVTDNAALAQTDVDAFLQRLGR